MTLLMLVRCDTCGIEKHIEEWRKIRRRIGVYPQLFMKTGTAYYDFCSEDCQDLFESKNGL